MRYLVVKLFNLTSFILASRPYGRFRSWVYRQQRISNYGARHSKRPARHFSLDDIPDHLRQRWSKNPIVYLDIGARDGLPMKIASFREIITVVSFEPDTEEADRLRSLAPPRDIVVSSAAGDRTGTASLHLTRDPGDSSLFEPNGPGLDISRRRGDPHRFNVSAIVEVPTTRIDIELATHGLGVDIVKIDTQGSELAAVRGMGQLRPFHITAEIAFLEYYRSQPLAWAIGGYLESLGYCCPTGPRGVYADASFVPAPNAAGREIITRDIDMWWFALRLAGLADFAAWQSRYLDLPSSSLSLEMD